MSKIASIIVLKVNLHLLLSVFFTLINKENTDKWIAKITRDVMHLAGSDKIHLIKQTNLIK